MNDNTMLSLELASSITLLEYIVMGCVAVGNAKLTHGCSRFFLLSSSPSPLSHFFFLLLQSQESLSIVLAVKVAIVWKAGLEMKTAFRRHLILNHHTTSNDPTAGPH